MFVVMLRSLSTPAACVCAALALSLLIVNGCESGGSSSAAVCGGYGEMHGDHCHCDAGYAVSADGATCEVAPPVNMEDVATAGGPVVGEEPDGGEGGPIEEDAHTGDDHGHEGDAGQGQIEGELNFSPTSVQVASVKAEDGTQVWLLEAVDSDVVLSIEIYASFGGPTSPGTTQITEVETSYATCGTCLILGTDCVAHGDHFDCAHTLMPRAEGQLHLDAIGTDDGGQFAGELLGIVFQEVTIASDYTTQAVSGGEVVHLDLWGFNVLQEATGGGQGEACGGHGQLHFDHCDCDPGYVPDPQNPLNCVPQ